MRRLTALLLALAVAGCTNEIDTSTRPTAVVGTYSLVAYGGKSLPTQLEADAFGTTDLVSGQLVIASDKSWTETRVLRYTANGVAQDLSFGTSGSWTLLDNASMQFNDKVLNYQFSGTAAGGSVTLNLTDGNTVIYTR
jgi:hypothetical protein